MQRQLARVWMPLATFYQFHRDRIDRAIMAGGMAALAYGLCRDFPSYPPEWQVFLGLAAFGAGCTNLTLGYFASIAVAAVPLWRLSPYLATLFLATAILAHRPILRRLPWVLLIVATPLFAQNLVPGLAPLIAGTVLDAAGGFWVGALAALWLKLIGGMAGLSTDLLTLLQQPILASGIAGQFAEANSLVTLQKLAELLNKDSRLLLLDLTQVLGWGLAAALVSWMWHREWARRQPRLGLAAALLCGTLLIGATIFALPIGLRLMPLAVERIDAWVLLSLLLSPALAGGVYGLRHALRRPLRAARVRPTTVTPQVAQVDRPPTLPDAPAGPAADDEEKPGDVILLEFD